jgi:hypothetical protein
MTKRIKPRPVTSSSWNIYPQHSPAKWIGTVETVDKEAAIEKPLSCSRQKIRGR